MSTLEIRLGIPGNIDDKNGTGSVVPCGAISSIAKLPALLKVYLN